MSPLESANAEKRKIEVEIATLVERINSLVHELDDATERRRSLVEAELSAAGQRLLDGEDSAPPDSKRAKEIRALGAQIEAIRPAIAICGDRQSELKKKLESVEEVRAQAAYRRIREVHDSAAEAVRISLTAALPSLAALLAADRARKAIRPEALKLLASEVDGEFSGAFVAEKLLAGITHFIRPAPLDDAANFQQLVEQSSQALSAEIEGDS